MRAHNPETRAAAIAALLAGQSITEVARTYDLPEGTVKSWKRQGINDPSPKKEIGDLVLEYLQENLITLRIQAEVFRDETWLKRQSAESAAVLHGVMTDKAVRLLEALSKNNAPDDNATEG